MKKGFSFEIWPKRLIIFSCETDQQMWGVIQESSRRRLETTLVSFLITPSNLNTNTIQGWYKYITVTTPLLHHKWEHQNNPSTKLMYLNWTRQDARTSQIQYNYNTDEIHSASQTTISRKQSKYNTNTLVEHITVQEQIWYRDTFHIASYNFTAHDCLFSSNNQQMLLSHPAFIAEKQRFHRTFFGRTTSKCSFFLISFVWMLSTHNIYVEA